MHLKDHQGTTRSSIILRKTSINAQLKGREGEKEVPSARTTNTTKSVSCRERHGWSIVRSQCIQTRNTIVGNRVVQISMPSPTLGDVVTDARKRVSIFIVLTRRLFAFSTCLCCGSFWHILIDFRCLQQRTKQRQQQKCQLHGILVHLGRLLALNCLVCSVHLVSFGGTS